MDTRDIYQALHEVLDPEVGVNVVDLGLVYEVTHQDGDVRVRMTMTTPACPLGSLLHDEVEGAIRDRLPDARSVEVEITFDPPWTQDRITPEGRRQLGWGA